MSEIVERYVNEISEYAKATQMAEIVLRYANNHNISAWEACSLCDIPIKEFAEAMRIANDSKLSITGLGVFR